MRFIRWFGPTCVVIAAMAQSPAALPKSPTPATGKAAVDQLIPWLLDENQQLRGVPFSELIFDTTGRKVLSFEANNAVDQRVAKAISAACDETMKRLNAPDSVIQNVDRINEISSHFEDTLRELLSTTPGLKCDFPLTAEGTCRLRREVILIRAPARARVRVAEHLAGGNGIMLNDLTGEGNISVRRD